MVCFDGSQDAAYPRQQHLRMEGFRNVIVGSDFQADDEIDQFTAAADDDHPDGVVAAKVAQQAETIPTWQADIQKHQVDVGVSSAN